jgi:hypothetical protein
MRNTYGASGYTDRLSLRMQGSLATTGLEIGLHVFEANPLNDEEERGARNVRCHR